VLPALLLGCDSFGTGSSGLSLTADVSSISPSDSTVTLTLTNDSPSPVYADFFCRSFVQNKVNGTWEDWGTLNVICARFLSSRVANTATPTSKLSIGRPSPIAPGESRQAEVNLRPDLEDATAIRFRVWVEYQKQAFRSPRPPQDLSLERRKTTSDVLDPPFLKEQGYNGNGYLISEEIPVAR